MLNIQKNIICLDGSDWYAEWFIPHEEFLKNSNARHIRNQEIDSGESAKVFALDYSVKGWMQGTVPGCARSFLMENNKISDPYYDRNCEQSIWVEDKNWWFRKEFKVPEGWKKRNFSIKFSGLDYACDIYFNGKLIGNHVGMFVQSEFDISDIILPGKINVIALGFMPAPKAEPHHSPVNDVTDFARYHRCQMSWGWDWSRRLVPTGIWDSIYIEAYDKVRIDDLWCRWQDQNLRIDLEIECIESGDYSFYLDVAPENFLGKSYNQSFKKYLSSGRQKLSFEVEVNSPELWYPNGNGKQNLYKISVQTENNLKEQFFAFRKIEMIRNPQSPEEAYPLTFSVNGGKIFIRGANWVPADLMPSRLSYEDYERQVRLAAEAGMNMFRVWGGGLIEKDAFYECCDRYGILVWQEFPHSCSKYPQDTEYLEFKRKEGYGIIKRLRNHPCIALWCGGNEMQYYGEQPDSPLLKQYEQLVNKNCPDLAYHTTSPDLSRLGERDHGPWHFMEHDAYNEHFRLFASEIGCNGMTEISSLEKFIPVDEKWPTGSAYKYHFLVTHGHKSLTKPLDKFDIKTIEEFSQASQFAQADALGYIMEHYRCLWPQSSGCLIWQYNESWPTLAWSVIDWYTQPKAAYYKLKKVCAPVILHLKDDSWDIKDGNFKAELWGINDLDSAYQNYEVDFTLMNSAGKVLIKDCCEARLTKDLPVRISEYNKYLELKGDNILFAFMRLRQNGKIIFSNERVYGYKGFRSFFKMPHANIRINQINHEKGIKESELYFEIENSSDVVAGGIRLNIPDLSVKKLYWKDNYFSLMPGEKRSVQVKVVNERARALEIISWNSKKILIEALESLSLQN